MRRVSYLIVALFACDVAFGQSDCTRQIQCNTSVSGSLEASESCLDQNTLWYTLFTFQGASQQVVQARVQSATFSPHLSLISPSSVVTHSSAGQTFAQIGATLTQSGTWTLRVRNQQVQVSAGPYTLQLTCGPPPGPSPTPTPNPTPFPTPSSGITVSPPAQDVVRGESASVTVRTIQEFGATVSLSVAGVPSNVSVVFDPPTIPAPGTGQTTMTVMVGPLANPGTYPIAVTATGGGTSRTAFYNLTVSSFCVLPTITQPPNPTIIRGTAATLTVEASGSEPLNYQWYRGDAPGIFFPVGMGREFVTPSIVAQEARYWVRVFNPCGTRDSGTIIIRTTEPQERRRPARKR
jgi:hypothetical protein